MLSGIAFLLLMAAEPPANPACFPWLVEKDALVNLATAASAAELRARFKTMIAPDRITNLFYAVCLAELEPGKSSDLQVISAIPSAELDLDVMYSFSDPNCDVPKKIAQFGGGGWLESAKQAVVRQARGLHEFLMLAWLYRSNAEIGELLPGYIDEIRRRRPREFDEAFRNLPQEVRKEIEEGRMLLPAE